MHQLDAYSSLDGAEKSDKTLRISFGIVNSQRQQPAHEEKSTAFSILAFSHKPNFTIMIVAIFNNSIKMGGEELVTKFLLRIGLMHSFHTLRMKYWFPE